MKTCNMCKKQLDVTDFHKDKGQADGLDRCCKKCKRIKRIKHYEKTEKVNPDPTKKARMRAWQKENYFRINYGMLRSEVKALMEKCNYQCEICGSKKRLCIDHCHKTGKIRGVLCHLCNSGLGRFQDSVEGLSKAIAYLTKPQ